MGYEIDFFPADKCKNFLQIDSITLGVHGPGMPKAPKITTLYLCIMSRKM